MGKILSKNFLNKGRQIELDMARGLAVLFMVLIHTQQYFASEASENSLFGQIADFLGGIPAAPVFMFLLGVGIIYTKKSEPKDFIKRGFLLILAAYVLNLLRGTAPNFIQWLISGQKEYLSLCFDEFIYVDILQFAGLAMIFFGVLKLMKANVLSVVVIGLVISGINFLVVGIQVDNYFIAAITGLVWGSNELSFFPFLTWMLYPIAGYLFASLLIRCSNKRRFYLISFVISSIVLLFSVYIFQHVLNIDIGLSSETGYYQHNLFGNIVFNSFVVWWISILYFVSSYIPGLIRKTLGRWSDNVTEVYFIQWVLIGWFVLFTGYNTLSLPYFILIFVIIFVLSDLISQLLRLKGLKIIDLMSLAVKKVI